MKRFHTWLFLIVTLLLWTGGMHHVSAASKSAPSGVAPAQASEPGASSIQVADAVFDFGEVMEGSEVIHEFTVKNDGKGVLQIEQVKPGCGCTAAQFDRAVPAGGAGKVTLKLDTRGYEGKVKKTATVFSNDPEEPRLILTLQGVVKTLIDVRPSSSVTFRGLADQQTRKVVDLVGSKPFRIQKVESTLEGKVAHELETMETGKGYRLKIDNLAKQGSYAGAIKLTTDFPKKPEIYIRITGSIEGDIAVRPQTVIVGRLAARQPPREGKISVVSTRGKAFRITKLTYDPRLIEVTQAPLESEPGYALEITSILENIPAGSREKTTLLIETDAGPTAQGEVQVYLVHSTESSPAAADKGSPAQDAR
jgi:hypothetical protein